MRWCRRLGWRGFTLIEVTLGLAILVLIFGVIFQLVQMAVLGADAAAKNSLRTREVSGLFALVRQTCLDLPVRSQLILEPRPAGRGYDLVISNSPPVILPGGGSGARSLRLALQKDPVGGGGVLVLQEMVETPASQGVEASSQTNTFDLMKDVVSLNWLAFDSRDRQEKTEWLDPVKPAYLKLELVRRDGSQTMTNQGIFWIPTGYSPSGLPPVDPVTRSPLTITN
jgi:hypothetical protein